MKRRRIHGGTGIATVLIAAGLLVPAGAAAAPAAPTVTTGATANKTQSTVTLTGRVNPNELETTYTFEYGTTRVYGTQAPSPPASVGKGNRGVAVTADIAGLAPATTYHYRLVARNSQRRAPRARDRTFTTKPPAAGRVARRRRRTRCRPGGARADRGHSSPGTGNAERQVVLQSNPFPYTQGFQNASNVQVTDADGQLLVPGADLVPLNTQYRVVLPQTSLQVVEPDRDRRRGAEGHREGQARAADRARRGVPLQRRASRRPTTARRSRSSG